jgi:hypothetical protein
MKVVLFLVNETITILSGVPVDRINPDETGNRDG